MLIYCIFLFNLHFHLFSLFFISLPNFLSSAFLQFSYFSLRQFRNFPCVRASPHCLFCINVLNGTSNYLKICLRIWYIAKGEKIKFSQWFYTSAKIVCALQQQSDPLLWSIYFLFFSFYIKMQKNLFSLFSVSLAFCVPLTHTVAHESVFMTWQKFKSTGLELKHTQSDRKCEIYCLKCGSYANLQRERDWTAWHRQLCQHVHRFGPTRRTEK